jgi:hypothetical protein
MDVLLSDLRGRRKARVHGEVSSMDNLDEVRKAMKDAEKEMKGSLEGRWY